VNRLQPLCWPPNSLRPLCRLNSLKVRSHFQMFRCGLNLSLSRPKLRFRDRSLNLPFWRLYHRPLLLPPRLSTTPTQSLTRRLMTRRPWYRERPRPRIGLRYRRFSHLHAPSYHPGSCFTPLAYSAFDISPVIAMPPNAAYLKIACKL
jgi:hypothetical protein